MTRIKPPALRPGDTIAIVAPGSSISRDALDAGCEALRRVGYQPLFLDSIFDRDLYFAGSTQRRIRELDEMFQRDDVRAILCARGGYGANYLLPHLDLEKIRQRPKIFIGYSDATALLTHLYDATGLITFHGPMAAKDWAHPDGIDGESWLTALSGSSSQWRLNLDSHVQGLIDGSADGILYGGCLSILVASLGTPCEIQTDGKLLFLEDVAEPPYRIDRMLMQLKLAGKFSGIRGIVFGEMLDCVPKPDSPFTLEEVILRIVAGLGVPIVYGVRSGHVSSRNLTLPIGVKAHLNVSGGRVDLQIMESAVTL